VGRGVGVTGGEGDVGGGAEAGVDEFDEEGEVGGDDLLATEFLSENPADHAAEYGFDIDTLMDEGAMGKEELLGEGFAGGAEVGEIEGEPELMEGRVGVDVAEPAVDLAGVGDEHIAGGEVVEAVGGADGECALDEVGEFEDGVLVVSGAVGGAAVSFAAVVEDGPAFNGVEDTEAGGDASIADNFHRVDNNLARRKEKNKVGFWDKNMQTCAIP